MLKAQALERRLVKRAVETALDIDGSELRGGKPALAKLAVLPCTAWRPCFRAFRVAALPLAPAADKQFKITQL